MDGRLHTACRVRRQQHRRYRRVPAGRGAAALCFTFKVCLTAVELATQRAGQGEVSRMTRASCGLVIQPCHWPTPRRPSLQACTTRPWSSSCGSMSRASTRARAGPALTPPARTTRAADSPPQDRAQPSRRHILVANRRLQVDVAQPPGPGCKRIKHALLPRRAAPQQVQTAAPGLTPGDAVCHQPRCCTMHFKFACTVCCSLALPTNYVLAKLRCCCLLCWQHICTTLCVRNAVKGSTCHFPSLHRRCPLSRHALDPHPGLAEIIVQMSFPNGSQRN